jgi:L-iditol 2-dehydrogenase
MGYPDEIFDVTTDLAANWERYPLIVSHPTISLDNVSDAF